MAKKTNRHTTTKHGALPGDLVIPALCIKQDKHTFYVFGLKASVLWPMVSINRRSETEDRGYQRVLSTARVAAVANHIKSRNPLPNSVLIALDKAIYDPDKGTLTIPSGKDVGWVIDGQHRIAGAHEAAKEKDIELCVAAFVEVDVEFQIEQFITINREAKGVPTSLLYDLLSHLPNRTKPQDVANERAVEIANELRHNDGSPLLHRIVVTQSPSKGQISITNFVRKVAPLVHPDRGALRIYTLPEQKLIISNYFSALKKVYSEQWSKADNVFFRTVGFGAMMNVFEEVFQITISSQSGFAVKDIEATFSPVKDFEFAQWGSYGSGNKAEMEAAQDFRTELNRSRAASPTGRSLRL